MPRRRHRVQTVAALRWFANSIENTALELYMADPGADRTLTKILEGTLSELKSIAESKRQGIDYGDCPVGWCPDMNRCYPCSTKQS